MCLMTKGWTCLTWLPQPEVSEIPNFFLTNVKFPWWTEQTIAQIIPENGLNPSLTVILSTHLQLNLCTMVTLGKWQGDCYIQGDHYNYTGQLCRKYKATEIFSKWLGDRNMQGERYIQGSYI